MVTTIAEIQLNSRVLEEHRRYVQLLECERWRTSTSDADAALKELILREGVPTPAQRNGYKHQGSAA